MSISEFDRIRAAISFPVSGSEVIEMKHPETSIDGTNRRGEPAPGPAITFPTDVYKVHAAESAGSLGPPDSTSASATSRASSPPLREALEPEFPPTITHVLTDFGCDILDESRGLISCPGQHLHTTANAVRDCKLFHNADGTWIAHCQHQSCEPSVRALNAALASHVPRTATNGRRRPAKGAPADVLVQAATAALPEILREYDWPQKAIVASGGTNLPEEDHWYLILGLFEDSDIVWIGRDVFDTGSKKHSWRFRPVGEWLGYPSCPGAFICPSTFRDGTHSRCASAVVTRKYLVVESDTLDRDQVGAVFRYLEAKHALTLRAVVDTAGKSLHGWFDFPPQAKLAQLEKLLPALGCDPALFQPAQPCRLPGAKRGDAYQRLLFVQDKNIWVNSSTE